MENNIIVYFVTEEGFLNPEIAGILIKSFERKGYNVEDVGLGTAYNMPRYLLGEVEKHIDKAVVVSLYMVGDMPVPMVFFSTGEVDAVVKGLEAAKDGESSFEILKRVHKEIRE